MEPQDPLRTKALNLIRSNFLIIALFSAGLILLIIGMIQLFTPQKGKEIEFVSSSVEGEKDATVAFYVHVAGAVIKPGVYKLSQDARVQDALIAAGGLSTDANRGFVEKSLNLAQKITDGAKIYIPTEGETMPAGISGNSGGLAAGPEGLWPGSGIISLNNATQSQFEALPKIGPVTAQKIISGRPYTTVEELVQKKIISQKTFEAIKEMIAL